MKFNEANIWKTHFSLGSFSDTGIGLPLLEVLRGKYDTLA